MANARYSGNERDGLTLDQGLSLSSLISLFFDWPVVSSVTLESIFRPILWWRWCDSDSF